MSRNNAELPSVPAGKVGCLLCGGFISVQGGDRARFIDHMSNEHDAKTDCHDVLLALCVMDTKEKGFLVKSSGPRLEEIGKGQSPSYSNSFLNKFATPAPPAPAVRQPAPQYRRGGPRGRPMQRQPRPAAPAQPPPPRSAPAQPPPRAAPPLVSMPSALRGNGSISISKVDQRKKCTMCEDILPNPGALVEHMNRAHLSILAGVNVNVTTSPTRRRDEDIKPESFSSRNDQQVAPFPTPNQPIPYQHQPRPAVFSRTMPSPGTPRPVPFRRSFPSNGHRMTRPASPSSQRMRNKQSMDLVKCNICVKTVEKSRMALHKLNHAEERKNEKSNVIRNDLKNKVDTNGKEAKGDKNQAKKSNEIEMIEIDDDGDFGVVNSPLPHDSLKEAANPSSEIQCKICDKNLASNMALKMHNNLKHPVKKEAIDAEMLLEEENDSAKDDGVKNEIDKMETMELLDNLVNFLNDA